MGIDGLGLGLITHSSSFILNNTKIDFIGTTWRKLHIGDKFIGVWDFTMRHNLKAQCIIEQIYILEFQRKNMMLHEVMQIFRKGGVMI